MLASIIALLAGAAMADSPPADPAESVPTPTQPAITTHDPTGTPPQPVETVPVNPVPSLPASLPVPGEQVRTMLFQRVRTQIVLYRNKTWRLQSLLGQRHSPGGNIWNLGSPEAGKKTLRAWQSRSYQLQLAARQRIQKDRRAVEYMLLVMGKRPAVRTLASSGSIADQLRQMKLLTNRTDWQIHHPPHLAAFTCIHHFEGSWKRYRRALLGRIADGLRLPADVRRLAAPQQGDSQLLDAAGTDLDGRESRPKPWFPPLAQYRQVLRPHLGTR
jgi:hypothetical protein